MKEDFVYRVDNDDPSRRKETIRNMFDGIVPTYDLLNRLLSLGIDRGWRRKVVKNGAGIVPGPVLDVCCGTGDLSYRLRRAGHRVVSLDFSLEMLKSGFRKGWLDGNIVSADASRLPFRENAFSMITIAFGIRNIPDIGVFLADALRVLVPGGTLQILELTRPGGMVMKMLYRFYLGFVLPVVGGIISRRRDAYRYLAGTIATFLDPVEMEGMLKDRGFTAVKIESRTGGIATIITAGKGRAAVS